MLLAAARFSSSKKTNSEMRIVLVNDSVFFGILYFILTLSDTFVRALVLFFV